MAPDRWPILILPALSALLIFAPTLQYGFVWDDPWSLEVAQSVRSPRDAAALFSGHAFAPSDSALARVGVVGYYRPFWGLSLAVDHRVWGLEPFGFHLTNVVLHAAATFLVTMLAWSLAGSALAANLAGLWFALHPTHTEAVAWVSARSEMLCTLFLVLAFLAYQRWSTSGAWRWLIAWVAGYASALLSKETAVVFPALLLLDELRRSAPRRHGLLGPAAAAAMAVGYVLVRQAVVVAPPEAESLLVRLAAAPGILLTYLRLLVVPYPSRVLYEPFSAPGWMAALATGIGFSLLVTLAMLVARRRPVLRLGLGWILLALLPVLGIVASLRPAPIAERYLYLPSVGAAIALAGVVAHVRTRSRTVLAWGAVVLAVLITLTLRVSASWRDPAALSARMASDAPGHPLARESYGLALERAGRLEQARTELEAARSLSPGFAPTAYNLGRIQERLGDLGAAEREYREAVALDSLYARAWFALGHLYEIQARWPAAALAFERAAATGASQEAAFGSALARHHMGDLEAAERAYREALQSRDDARIRQNLGSLYGQQGRWDDARIELERAVALAPDLPQAHYNLGEVLRMLHRDDEAERAYRAAIAQDSTDARAYEGLGRLLLRSDRRDEARRHLERSELFRATPP